MLVQGFLLYLWNNYGAEFEELENMWRVQNENENVQNIDNKVKPTKNILLAYLFRTPPPSIVSPRCIL